jgi:hypothetical protein
MPYVVDKVTLGKIFLRVFQFFHRMIPRLLCSHSFDYYQHCMILTVIVSINNIVKKMNVRCILHPIMPKDLMNKVLTQMLYHSDHNMLSIGF